jgi:protein-disulfide isomerase
MSRSIVPVVMAAVMAVPCVAGAGGVEAKGKPPAPAPASSPSPAAPADVVAIIAGEPFTARDLEQVAGARLFQLKTQQYQAQRQILDEEIGKRLLEREAAARKVTVAELLKQEVEAKVKPVTAEEQKAFYDQNKARMGNLSEADALKRIETGLGQQRSRERQNEFVDSLRASANVRVLLDPPRLTIEAGTSPSRGPADAPIQIVEFSDFQCPFCSRATGTLKKLEDTYPGKIRVVYRDFPLVSIHPQAAKAAEAAACANDQGKFWAMHDVLFGHQDKLQEADLKKSAADLGLEATAFNECLDSGKHAADWQKNAAEGEKYGVQSTPAFFINGRMVVGAQPYESFAKVVDEELARSAPAPAPAGKPDSR